MSTWDAIILDDDHVAELLDDIDALDPEEQAEALRDACLLAVDDATEGESRAGLGAATIAAIWSGAPFSAATRVDEHPFIRAGIGDCPEELREAAAEVFELLIPALDAEEQEMAGEFAEAVE